MTPRPLALLALVTMTTPCACASESSHRAEDSRPTGAGTASAAERDVAATRQEYRVLAMQNRCPDGYESLQGQWRFIGESHTLGYEETLSVHGTHFVNRLKGHPDGQPLETELEGEIRCLFSNRVLFIVERAAPEGGFDNKSGDEYPCDILEPVDGSRDRVLLSCYFDWDLRTAAGKEFEYGRIEPD